jgi:hypothetical protein
MCATIVSGGGWSSLHSLVQEPFPTHPSTSAFAAKATSWERLLAQVIRIGSNRDVDVRNPKTKTTRQMWLPTIPSFQSKGVFLLYNWLKTQVGPISCTHGIYETTQGLQSLLNSSANGSDSAISVVLQASNLVQKDKFRRENIVHYGVSYGLEQLPNRMWNSSN